MIIQMFRSSSPSVPRLNRLFAADGRCVNVAIDHGLFNEHSFLEGIRDMPTLVAELTAAGGDAIQLSPGQARLLQDLPDSRKPALVLRTDVANVYGPVLLGTLFSEVGPEVVEQALRLDAACVVVNLLFLPDHPEVHQACVQNILRLQPQCERYGMPLMIEPLVMQRNELAGGYQVDGDAGRICALVRQAVELGGDVIKADPTDNVDDYAAVIEVAAGRPVLVRGGGKTDLQALLPRIARFLEFGAAGIVFGRNVFQHRNPQALARLLGDLVHSRLPLADACKQAEALS